MDYRKYRMSLSEHVKYAAFYMLLDGAVSYLFYHSILAFFVLLPGYYWFVKENQKVLAKRRRERLEQGFLMGMRYAAAALEAGYSIENAFSQALTELRKICSAKDVEVLEFQRIVSGLQLNRPVESLMADLAVRSNMEDIQTFSEVFAAVKRTGGDLTAIIRDTVASVSRKEETRQEIEVCLASKKLEQNIMSAVPCVLIAYVGITSPGFLDVMYGNAAGVLIMSICLGVYVFAFLLGRKIVDIEV